MHAKGITVFNSWFFKSDISVDDLCLLCIKQY